MMRVPNPRERTRDGYSNHNVGNETGDEDSIVAVLVVDEDEDHLEDEPQEAGCCASRVDTAQMLEDGGAPKAEPQWCPLGKKRSSAWAAGGDDETDEMRADLSK